MTASTTSSLPSDPVAALAPVSLWVARLGSLESPNARITLLQALRSLNRGNLSPDILTTLMQLDEQCQLILDKAEGRMKSSGRDIMAENTLSRDMQTIYQEFANGYKRFIDDYLTQSADSTSVPERIKEITARSIHCHCGIASWTFFLSEALPESFWRQLHALYLFAEQNGFEVKTLAWYDGYPTTVANVYMRMLFLDMFNTGNLTPLQISIADKRLHDWCGEMKLERDYANGKHHYHVNTADPRGLQKVAGIEPLQLESMRYLDTGRLGSHIASAKVAIRSGNPDTSLGFNFKEFPVGEYIDLLDKLARICPPPGGTGAQRIHDRARAKALSVDLIFGIDQVMDAIRNRSANPFSNVKAETLTFDSAEEADIKMFGFVTDRTRLAKLELAAAQSTESGLPFKLHDLSVSGFGVTTDKNTSHTVALGTIVAMRTAGDVQWKIGSVVRKVPHVDDLILIGIELISASPVAVSLQVYDPDFPVDTSDKAVDALYLPGQAGKADSLLIRAAQYSSNNQHKLITKKGTFAIRLNRVIKQGTHWVAAGLEVISKIQS
jgi:cyclic-di-GMP-binding protein